MFGYVRVFQPELKIGEFEQYRGVYCALCKNLHRRYGAVLSWTLSYDFTFLAILRMALSKECVGFSHKRCHYNPLKKRLCCGDSPALDETADAAVLLTYYKLRDTLADDRFFRRFGARLALLFVSRARRKAARRQPELDEVLRQQMAAQAQLEQERTEMVDKAAEPSARMLAFLAGLSARDDREKTVLDRFGYCLGRWIYLVDAVDDLEEDGRRGRYNPYLVKGFDEAALPAVRQNALFSLNACLAECVAAYHLLEIRRFDGILQNILTMGMPQAQQAVLKTDQKARGKRHE